MPAAGGGVGASVTEKLGGRGSSATEKEAGDAPPAGMASGRQFIFLRGNIVIITKLKRYQAIFLICFLLLLTSPAYEAVWNAEIYIDRNIYVIHVNLFNARGNTEKPFS